MNADQVVRWVSVVAIVGWIAFGAFAAWSLNGRVASLEGFQGQAIGAFQNLEKRISPQPVQVPSK